MRTFNTNTPRQPLRMHAFEVLAFPFMLAIKLLAWMLRLEMIYCIATPGTMMAAARRRMAIEAERHKMNALLLRIGESDNDPAGTREAVARYARLHRIGASPIPDPDVEVARHILDASGLKQH